MPGARGLGAQPFVDAENAQNLAGGLDSALREHEPRQRVPRVDPMRVERAPMVQRIDAPHDQGDRLAVQFGDALVVRARQFSQSASAASRPVRSSNSAYQVRRTRSISAG